eukprot:1159903-Pelagomonas_calceolata.AAC.7
MHLVLCLHLHTGFAIVYVSTHWQMASCFLVACKDECCSSWYVRESGVGHRAAIKLYNMLGTDSNTLRRVMQADLKLQSKDDKHWTAQLIQTFQGCESGGAISLNAFSADLRYRLQGVWREFESVNLSGNNNKLATYQAWFATPFACNARQTYA